MYFTLVHGGVPLKLACKNTSMQIQRPMQSKYNCDNTERQRAWKIDFGGKALMRATGLTSTQQISVHEDMSI
jgi:hypothetical protein